MKTYSVVKFNAIALIGIAVSLFLFYLINDKKVQRNNIIVDNAMAKSELKIVEELHKAHLVIESMSFFFENTEEISSEVFQRFTNPFKDDLYGIKALEWAPSIFEFERKKNAPDSIENIPDQITELDESNTLIKARKKELYYPISVINPQERDWVLGYDLYSEKNRRSAIKEATSTREMVLTAPILLANDNNTPGFLALKTVMEPNDKDVKGVVAAVYRMDQFLQNILTSEMEILDITVTDQMANKALLYGNYFGDTQPKKNSKIKAANRVWNISFYPKPAYAKFPHTVESYFVLFLGLIATTLFIFNLKGRIDHSLDLELKVLQRTKELEVSNKQKENLLKEIHHRVMNNLQITSSLINLQKRKLHDEEAIYALSSSQNRIKAIALIHQKIYEHEGLNAVDLYGYLENLIKSHKCLSPNVNYTIDCPKIYIDLDTAVPLAIITSEIVVNALKHAFSTNDSSNMLYILARFTEKRLLNIVISDNGVGLPVSKNLKESTGLGYDIIKKMCRQLEAEYEYSSSSSGTAFSLQFKLRKVQTVLEKVVPQYEHSSVLI